MKKQHPRLYVEPGIIIKVWYVLLYQLNHHRDKVIILMSHSGQNKVTKNLCVSLGQKRANRLLLIGKIQVDILNVFFEKKEKTPTKLESFCQGFKFN